MSLSTTDGGRWILDGMTVEPSAATSLIGRAEDLAALDAGLDQARNGEPVTVVLAGEAGIGKTRLVQEFSERAFAQGARLLSGACIDVGDATLPYGAVVDALRTVPAEAFEELPDRLRRGLAALGPEAPGGGEPVAGGQRGGVGGRRAVRGRPERAVRCRPAAARAARPRGAGRARPRGPALGRRLDRGA